MKLNVLFVVGVTVSSLFIATGCNDKGSKGTDSLDVDSSAVDTMANDSIAEVIEDTPMPVAADELFDDFFFNFAASRKIQKERIVFPLIVDNFGTEKKIEKVQWKRERFFMPQGYYTLIFHKYSQTKLVKDTAVSDVTVEKIIIPKGIVTEWHFKRERGLWHMNSIKKLKIKNHADVAFLKFYERFATDSAFQQRSLYNPVIFTGPDPDDDFSTMTGEVLPEQWPMFAPWLPSGTIYNIIYGSEHYPDTNFRVFMLRGISNGMQMEMQFVKSAGKWRLKKINT